MRKICIIGSGSIGTALGSSLAGNPDNDVMLLSIEGDVIDSVNNESRNHRYFPGIKLNPSLKATSDLSVLSSADMIFLAIPSSTVSEYLTSFSTRFNPDAPVINLAKGFSVSNKIITDSISRILKNPACSMKGPTFARELVENEPTAFTFASEHKELFDIISDICKGTSVITDFSTDVRGVELISILKNIYAIVIGIVDARFSSPNLRFLLLTKAFKEMRNVLIQFGGKQETLFKYCGFGDFTLTALNDLSRNRTLGLFIGKGFFTRDISNKVLLEGKIATKIFCEEISKKKSSVDHFIISELYKVFKNSYNISEFIDIILKDETRDS